jgi:hypothetical protein
LTLSDRPSTFPGLRLIMRGSAPSPVALHLRSEDNCQTLDFQATSAGLLCCILEAIRPHLPLACALVLLGRPLDPWLTIGEIGVATDDVILVRDARP